MTITRDLGQLIDASGNLGLGVTPSAWWSGRKSFQFGGTGNSSFVASAPGTANYAELGSNYFTSSTPQDVYYATGTATRYVQETGAHKWFYAPSGTAGAAISFTQAMTLDASGNLGVGVTSPSYPLHINKSFSVYGTYLNNTSTSTGDYSVFVATGASSGMPLMMLGAGGTTVGNAGVQGAGYVGTQNNTPLVFVTNDAARARITSGGDLLVGTTTVGAGLTEGFSLQMGGGASQIHIGHTSGIGSGELYAGFSRGGTTIGSISQNGTTAVLFNTTSDRRLKNNIVPAPSASDVIDAIEIVSHDWKAAPDEHVTYGVIAQDLALVAPQAVLQGDDGDEIEKTWGVDYSKLVPMLIKEIQSLRARVAALEAA